MRAADGRAADGRGVPEGRGGGGWEAGGGGRDGGGAVEGGGMAEGGGGACRGVEAVWVGGGRGGRGSAEEGREDKKAAASIAAREALRSTARARRWRLALGEAIKDWRRRGRRVGLLSSSGGICVSDGVEFSSSAWRRVVGRVEVEIVARPAENSVLLRFWPFWSIPKVI